MEPCEICGQYHSGERCPKMERAIEPTSTPSQAEDDHGTMFLDNKHIKIVEFYSVKHPSGRVHVALLEDGTLAIEIKKLTDRSARQIVGYQFRISPQTGIMLNVALYELMAHTKAKLTDAVTVQTSIENTEEDKDNA